jgi:Na+/melibiose symporter-like transporter
VTPFVLYTLARLGLFVVAFGLIWLAAGAWLEWNSVTALATAVLAMIVSSIAALFLLRGLRERFAATLEQRAKAVRDNVERSRRKEDID